MTKETQENIKRASWDETVEEYHDNSNQIIAFVLGIVVMLCGIIYVVNSVLSSIS